jgi:signal transduction histidine kinase
MPGVGGTDVHVDGARPVARGRRAARTTRAPIAVGGQARGEITVFHDGRLPAEEGAALELLALQAAQAVEQIRERERERERAAVDAELERVRAELLDERSALGRLLGAQEAERRRVAETLQEQLAQVLAAVLMGLRVLEHGTSGSSVASVDALRAQVTEALVELRALAATLRPPSVQHLGLAAALRSLALDASSDDRAVSVRVAGDADGLPDALATGTYRILEDAFAAAREGAITVDVLVEGEPPALELRLSGAADERTLAAMRARVELLGGALEVTPAGDGATLAVVRLGEGARAVARP